MVNRPIKKWRSGNLEVAVWQNEREVDGATISFKTVSLSISWKKRDEEVWRSDVLNLRKNDISKVLVLLQKVQEELLLTELKKEVEEEED